MSVRFAKWMYLFVLSAACLAGMTVFAQQEITVNVHVNRLPDGSYPTKLYQFNNTPGLVMVSIINHTGNAYTIYLNGTLSGDNGVQITTAKGYQPASLTLKAFETKTLNAIEAGSLFDPNSLVYLSGSTSIKPSVFGEQGLPEGTYQVCVRAYDAATRKPLSDEQPLGCSNIFTVATLEPPVILSPIDEDTISNIGPQNMTIRWSRPPGSPPSTQYRILMYEAFNNMPDQAIIQSSRQPFFDYTVQGTPMFLYSSQFPQLQTGRSYTMVVVASDPSGNATFRNKGVSEAIRFTYQSKTNPGFRTLAAMNVIVCDCGVKVSDDKMLSDVSAIAVGSKLQIDGFDMEITKLISNSGGKLRGDGKIKVPFLKLLPVEVQFEDEDGIRINAENVVVAGRVVGKRRGDEASMVPAYDPANPNLTLDPNTVQNFGQYISNYIASNLNPAEALGYALPIGLNDVSGITIAITDMTFAPEGAVFNAGAIMDIPEANMTIALGGGHLCFSNDKMLCGTGRLYLEQNLNLASTGIALVGQSPTDEGTYVELTKDGFDHMRIKGQYTFPASMLEKDGGGQAVAQLTVESTKSWSDWIATVNIDPFHITGSDDFGFMPTTAFYDHSDKSNPSGIPPSYEEGQTPTWRGFFIPLMGIKLPPIIKSFSNNNRLTATAQNFIIDNQGVTGTVGVDNVLSIGDGSLGSWQYSVDRIEATFVKNSFTNGNMHGKIVLPITDANDVSSQLDYNCLLTKTAGLQFQFTVVPKNDVKVPMWLLQLKIDATSNINVTAGGGAGFKAQAILNGDLSFNANLGSPLGNVDLTLISFNNLTLNSSAPFISDGQFVTGHNSPPKFVDGLPVSIPGDKSISLVFDQPRAGIIGMKVPLEITLADVQSLPKATVDFIVGGSLTTDAQGRVHPDLNPKVFVDEIAVKGDLGPVSIDGFVKFFDNDPRWGSGVAGKLAAKFQPGFSVNATALFGKSSFSYFFVGANLTLPAPGVPIGGGIIPLSLYGFAGGVYHNVKLNITPDPNKPDMAQALINGDDPMTMFSPSQGTVGFMGGITLASTDQHILVANGVLDFELNDNMSPKQFAILIDAGMFTADALNVSNSVAKGNGQIAYDFSQKVLTANVGVHVTAPGGFADGSGTLALLANFGNGDWYFKIGEAEPEDKRVILNLNSIPLFHFDFKAYLNVGKNLNLPPELQDIYNSYSGKFTTPTSYKDPVTNQEMPYTSTNGLLIGARAEASMDLNFLIFYAKLGGYLGFDIALLQDSRKCEDGSQVGFHGYYALGNLEAGLNFDFGIDIDVWFFSGKVSLAAADLKVSISAGFPNPLVLDGMAEAHYSVLDDLISGTMHFRVKYSSGGGANCSVPANPFGDLPLISAIYPGRDDQAVNIMSNINVAFNFPVNDSFTVRLLDESDGTFKPHTLKVVVDLLSVNEVGGKGYVYAGQMDVNGNTSYVGTTDGATRINAIFHNALLYGWQHAFEPVHQHKIQLSVSGYELIHGVWRTVDRAHMDSTLYFTTGECIGRIDSLMAFTAPNPYSDDGTPPITVKSSAAVASYPFPNQRYFLPKQYSHGYIKLAKGIDCLQDAPAATGMNRIATATSLNRVTGYDLFVKFISLADNFEVPVSQQGLTLNFNIPELSPSTVYKIAVVKRPIYASNNISQVDLASLRNKNVIVTQKTFSPYRDVESGQLIGVDAKVESFQANEIVSSKTPDDIEIYSSFFKTSRFKTMQEKVQGAYQAGGVAWGLMMPSFNISMLEGLDVYDANGFVFDGDISGQQNWFIPPILHLDEKYTDNPWMQKIIAPLVANYNVIMPYDPMSVYNQNWQLISPLRSSNTFLNSFVEGMEPFTASGAEQPLSSNEIPFGLKYHGSLTSPVLSATAKAVQQPGNNKLSPTQIKVNK